MIRYTVDLPTLNNTQQESREMQTVYLGSVEHADGYNGATAIAHVCHDGEEFLAVYPHGWHTVSVNSPAVRGLRVRELVA